MTLTLLGEEAPGPARSADAGLVRAAAAGDEEAFAQLVRRHAAGLYRFLLRRGLGPLDAEAAAQDAFVQVHRHLARYDERYAFSTWLYTIAARLAERDRRRAKRQVALDADALTAPPAGEQPDAEEAALLWERARTALPARQFEAVRLRYGEGFALADVARVLGITALNARVLLHRARRTLARAFGVAEPREEQP